uniref:Uncharacterized protein n=1 Tax=Sipha flava TaxID=143950 RepID=A0A2S2QXP6_9HEMI
MYAVRCVRACIRRYRQRRRCSPGVCGCASAALPREAATARAAADDQRYRPAAYGYYTYNNGHVRAAGGGTTSHRRATGEARPAVRRSDLQHHRFSLRHRAPYRSHSAATLHRQPSPPPCARGAPPALLCCRDRCRHRPWRPPK